MRAAARFLLLCVFLGLAAGCAPPKPPPPPEKPPLLEKISAQSLPALADDLDAASLREAVEKSLAYYRKLPDTQPLAFGDREVPASVFRAALDHALALMSRGEFTKDAVARDFDLYAARGDEAYKPTGILVTGYFEPVLEGREKPDAAFTQPLYALPPDLLTVDLERFNPQKYKGERVIGRVEGNKVVPYYTRAQIDGEGKLGGARSELAWLKDPVSAFFLQVQGSGVIDLGGGKTRRVGYAGANGRPYRSVGRYFIEKNLIPKEQVSLQAIRGYLAAHPELVNEVLFENESYVFFRWVKEGPVGSIAVVLTAGRSFASDPKVYPRGCLAFLESEKPRLDAQGNVLGWEPLSRFAVNQDAGGAIKGPGRLDLFCGTGEGAEAVAGRLKHPGRLFILVKKGALD